MAGAMRGRQPAPALMASGDQACGALLTPQPQAAIISNGRGDARAAARSRPYGRWRSGVRGTSDAAAAEGFNALVLKDEGCFGVDRACKTPAETKLYCSIWR